MGQARLEVVRRANGKHDWQLIAGNGELIVATVQGYENKSEALSMGRRVISGEFADAEVHDQ